MAGTAVSVWQAFRAACRNVGFSCCRGREKGEGTPWHARRRPRRCWSSWSPESSLRAPRGESEGLGRKVTLRKAIESALPYVDKSFPNQPLIEARLRLTLGESFLNPSDGKTAVEQEEAAPAIYKRLRGPDDPDTLSAMNSLGTAYDLLGRQEEALKLREATFANRKADPGA